MVRLSYNTSFTKRYVVKKQAEEIIIDSDNSKIKFIDGSTSIGSCIICADKFCAKYKAAELSTPTFQSFPHNTSDRVCPTEAISFSSIDGRAVISSEKCIGCGLCVHRCPTAAIHLDTHSGKASVTFDASILSESGVEEQKLFIESAIQLKRKVSSKRIPASFFSNYEALLVSSSKRTQDLSEIVVRNTLLNMGIHCNINAVGNNHIRTEFFGEEGGMVIMGESDIVNSDTLAIPRRILDDMAVLTGRYDVPKEKIVSLSVINGLPNKRTDYYEVVYDVSNILGIQINTVTYHILWLLNYMNQKLRIEDFKSFIIDKDRQNLLPALANHIPAITSIDSCCEGFNYKPEK